MRKTLINVVIFIALLLVGCNNTVPLDEYTLVVEERESLRAELNNSISKEEYDRVVKERDDLAALLKTYQSQASDISPDTFELAGYWTEGNDVMQINNDRSFVWYQFAIGGLREEYGNYIRHISIGIVDDYTLYIKKEYDCDEKTFYYAPDHIDDSVLNDSTRVYIIKMLTNNAFQLYEGEHMTNMSFSRQIDYELKFGDSEETNVQNESNEAVVKEPDYQETIAESSVLLEENDNNTAEYNDEQIIGTSESTNWTEEEYIVSQNGANIRYAENLNRVYTQLAKGTNIGRVKMSESSDWAEFSLDGITVVIQKDYISPLN